VWDTSEELQPAASHLPRTFQGQRSGRSPSHPCNILLADFLDSIPVKPIGLQNYEGNGGVPLAEVLFRYWEKIKVG
jgi:hypothetical protein